jgi:hypothetical protein
VRATTATPVAAPTTLAELPQDVRRVVGAAIAALAGEQVELTDDGTFVTLRAPWPGDHLLPELHGLGGDLRILAPGGAPTLELRWCRDGRADPRMAVVRGGEPWPEVPALAVDFHGIAPTAAEFLLLVDAAAAWRARGRRVQFLNVAAPLLAAAERAGRIAEVPIDQPIGPQLPETLARLWGHP